ncbi:MAG: aminotransferase class IV [Melioribacteraceae bacterium]
MYRLIESIKLAKKEFHNLAYHQQRMNKTRKELFGLDDEVDLATELKIPAGLSDSVFKCRVIYSEKILSVEFHPYEQRNLKSLQIVHADEIDYAYKYEDRSKLQKLLCKCTADDVLIIKNGFVTDTSYSNIVLSKDSKFFTPDTFLLNGTKRQKLLDEKIIEQTKITTADIVVYEKVYIINSMMDLEEQSGIPVANIEGL